MRIAFDGRALTAPAAGVRRYTRDLFEAMHRVAPDVDLTAIGADAQTLPAGVHARSAGFSLPTNLGWSVAGLPFAARRAAFDVFHAPAYTAPLWGVRPLVVTIHDVSYARHPEWYPYHLDPARRAFYRASARRADRVLTDSSFSRDEIVAAYGIDPSRIDVIPLGVGERFSPREGIPRELFVLHVGDLHARRNLPMLLDIVLRLRRDDPRLSSLRLVLAGADRGLLDGLRRQANAAPEALDYAGQPNDEALTNLYRRAAVFAYPSRYEGFGLPVLEAMACGTPVVASHATSVPEVAGDAALLVDVNDGQAWRGALHGVLTNAARATDLSARGLARAKEFTWERTATKTLASYRRAIGSPESALSPFDVTQDWSRH